MSSDCICDFSLSAANVSMIMPKMTLSKMVITSRKKETSKKKRMLYAYLLYSAAVSAGKNSPIPPPALRP